MKFSYFNAPISNIYPSKKLSIKGYVNMIKGDDWKEKIILLRKDSSQKNKIKTTELGYIIPSGVFEERKKDKLNKLSSIICWDLDNLNNLEETKQKLSGDEHVLLIYTSPSGNGLKLFARFEGLTVENYESNWKMVKDYFINKFESLKGKFDEQTKDISRACFVSWDPQLFYNQNSIPFQATSENSLLQKEKINLESISDKRIIEIISPYWKENHRNNLSLSLAGFLRKKGYGIDRIKKIITSICLKNNDRDVKDRIGAIDWTFKKDERDVKGYSGLKEILLPKDLDDLIGKEKVVQTYKLQYKTCHMPRFENLNKIINLFGESYLVVAKSLYYHILGNILKKHETINYQGLTVDTRIPLYYFLNSGSGKSNIKYAVKKTLPPIFLTCSEATSLHPEQLIGKMKEVGKGEDKKIKEIKGYFRNDVLIMDETRQLFTSKELKHQEIRQYICLALDAFGKNQITKQLVDFGSEHQLKYEPNCSLILFSQPVRIRKEVVESGFIRRGLLIGGIKQSNISEIYDKRLNAINPEKDIEIFSNFTEKLLELGEGWEFEDIKDDLKKYATMLNNFGINHSEKASAYMKKIYHQTLLDTLLKFSCIAAVFTRGEKKVKKCDVETAYMDLFEILNSTFNVLNSYSESFYDFDLDSTEYESLTWLYNSEAISEEKSRISIIQFKEKISEIEKIGEDAAKKRYKSFKDDGLIKTKLSGTVSTVWISEDKLTMFEKQSRGSEHYEEYLRICKGVRDISKF